MSEADDILNFSDVSQNEPESQIAWHTALHSNLQRKALLESLAIGPFLLPSHKQ